MTLTTATAGSNFCVFTSICLFQVIGHVMDPSPKLLWHKSRSVDRGLLQHPVPCALSIFNETDSDQCLQELVGRG
ncbi:UPF0764 protein C16orf89-like protein [Trichonephila clavata]|uniref:UPF0764 protein C16orf89-like protein n=1 Tax=Trichonephila clavata TaxID=2740835 RepID=A0A8X6HF95_TRICU|nr:UPF0764 protein C16orf89-like protein [Trichonephila clavata]